MTPAEAMGSIRDTTRRILHHPANRGRRGRALILYVVWQVWERVVRRPWTIRLGTARRIRLYPHGTVAALVLYCRMPDYEEMSFVRDYLRAGDLFVDVGANVGLYSLWACEQGGVDVLAFEPSTVAYDRAVENVELNGLVDRIRLRRLAVGKVAAEVRVTTGLDVVNHLVDIGASGEEGNATEVVAQTTLDQELDGRPPALIKIDVEGAELDVLRGGRQTILRHRPPLLVEVNDREGLEALLAELGYRAWRYDPDTRRLLTASVGDTQNVLALADIDQARARLDEPYARAVVALDPVFPPESRTPLPEALKTRILRRVPLVDLMLLRRDLLNTSGWTRSGRAGVPVAQDGSPLPWYTYPAIHFLEARIRPEMTVFEYGSGHSTLWWAQRANHVAAVESDPAWVERLKPRLPSNVDLRYQPAGASGRYANAILDTGRRFDVVVIDGDDRSACALSCLRALADDGVVVWDNSDWTALFAEGMDHLEAQGFRRIDLRGLGALNWREWTTSVFYRPGRNCLGI